MGLDNFVSKYSKRIKLDDAILEKTKNADICLCCYDGCSFRGKVYVVIIDTICNESLYYLLCPQTLGVMASKLNDFIETYIEGKFENTLDDIDIRNYIEDYDDSYEDERYIITKKELYSLRDFFKICKENNLYLHSDY
jgi:hypothetical protein